MVFSSLIFLFLFLPVVLLLYYLCPNRHRNLAALAASLFFYAWGAPRFLFVLVVGSAVDYYLSRAVAAAEPGSRPRRRLLALAIALNLAALLYFKYANFFAAEINRWLDAFGARPLEWSAVALPIGISFVTFHRISYLVDVYRGISRPPRTVTLHLLYIALFPQLIAGPIIRYHDVADQLENRRHTAQKMFSGIWRFCIGLAKKVILANVLAEVADGAFGMDVSRLPCAYAWLGALCYAFQIYFDFSGYSDMAIGLGRMLGIDFLENFNCPYIARSFSDFWRRWHISLSNWMREYLYIPLGGNRHGAFHTYLNLWVVFVLSGFWHGASWSFVVWGAYHGLFLTLDKILWPGKREPRPAVLFVPLTFLLVLVGWVFFRADTLGHALAFLRRMALPGLGGAPAAALSWSEMLGPQAALALAAAVLISFAPAFRQAADAIARWTRERESPALALAQWAVAVLLLVWSAASLAAGNFNPFIYFRF
jgi:alginate O-acetyltransferase complex protein AlgI